MKTDGGCEDLIETRDLTKCFGRVHALDGATLHVQRGAIHGFLGPNGAGKTTAIRVLMGFIRPTSGTAQILGLDPWADGVAIRRQVGYLVTADALYDDMSGVDQLDFAATLSGRPPALRERAREALELSQTALGNRLGTYSKGMRQKLALIAALQHQPELLILDEPSDGLDPLIQRNFERLLREMNAAGTTIFMSSHDLAEVERTCSLVAVIRAGRIVANETVARLKQRFRRVAHITFSGGLPGGIAHIPGTTVLAVDGERVALSVGEDINDLLRFLALHPVSRFELDAPGLEDVFMDFYRPEEAGTPASGQAVASP